MIDQVDNAVQEGDIVGDQNECVFVIIQVTFQPFDVVFIQIVGRFVQQQNVGFFQQEFSKQDLGALSAGKL